MRIVAPFSSRATPQRAESCELNVFPKAAHGFDNPSYAGGGSIDGMTLKFDPRAAGRASADLRKFLRGVFGR